MIAICDLGNCGISASDFRAGEPEILVSMWDGDKKVSKNVHYQDIVDITELCGQYDKNIDHAGTEKGLYAENGYHDGTYFFWLGGIKLQIGWYKAQLFTSDVMDAMGA